MPAHTPNANRLPVEETISLSRIRSRAAATKFDAAVSVYRKLSYARRTSIRPAPDRRETTRISENLLQGPPGGAMPVGDRCGVSQGGSPLPIRPKCRRDRWGAGVLDSPAADVEAAADRSPRPHQ